jgi:hypothetical protein
MTSAARFLVVTAAIAAGTWLAGWWAVLVVAVIAGALRTSPLIVAGASAAGWALLLAIDAFAGSISPIAGTLGAVMSVPAPLLYFLTLLFPALLGWSASVILSGAKERLSPSLRSG